MRPAILTFATVVLATALLATTSVNAYPSKWPACTPPSSAQGGHYADNGSDRPLTDRAIKFTLLYKNRATAVYCPGGTYSLKITWPAARHAFITTNLGSLTPNDGCGGKRYRFPDPRRAAGWTATIKFPCSAKGSAVVRAFTARSSSSPFQQLSATFKIGSAAACRAFKCPRGL